MKFDYCIGNPAYNADFTNSGDNGNYAAPVYNDFLDAAYEVSNKVERFIQQDFCLMLARHQRNGIQKC